MISAEGIMALHDPTLRELYDLKVSGVSDDPFMSQYPGYRCLCNVTPTLCLLDDSNETLKKGVEVLTAFWISESLLQDSLPLVLSSDQVSPVCETLL